MYVSVLPAPDRAATWHDASRTKRRWEILLVDVLQIAMEFQGSYAVDWPRLLYDSSQTIPPNVPNGCSYAPFPPTSSSPDRLLSSSRMTTYVPGNISGVLK